MGGPIGVWESRDSRSRSVAAPPGDHGRPRPEGADLLPDPLDVLEATLGPAARVARLDDADVVRTADRPDHPAGNAIHHRAQVPDGGLADALADLDRRFPGGRARLVVPLGSSSDEVPSPVPREVDDVALVPTVVEVLRRDEASAVPGREDLTLTPPGDDRDWHGITVLQRHAVAPGEDRARGRQDDRLRWWVDGLRELVRTGRARVLRAVRFGTPVGVGALHWAPGAVVDEDHAGLAVVADVVVHPAHRGIGVARTITEALVAQHLADFPRAEVAAVAELVPDAIRSDRPRGWERHARLLALTRPEDPDGA